MNPNEMDKSLERLFEEVFDLPEGQETAFLHRFEARRRDQDRVWTTFAVIMIGLNARLHPLRRFAPNHSLRQFNFNWSGFINTVCNPNQT